MTTFARAVTLTCVCLTLAALVNACSSVPTSKPVAPTVKVLSVKPLKIGLQKQELGFELELSNPNTFDLALQSLDFIASVDKQELAQGLSNERVTIPAQGDATLNVVVSTRISRVLGQLLLLVGDNNPINYDVRGYVKLANWPLKIPFNVDGQLDNRLRN